MVRIAFLIAAALQSPMGAGSEYIFVGGSPAGSRYYLDPTKVRIEGDFRTVWVWVDYSQNKTVKLRRSMERWSFNCSAETTRTASWVDYLPDGTVAQTGDGSLVYRAVVPGTIGEQAMDIVCKK